jgi:glycosyltransferase involved in cell wall biosynthesis
VVGRALRDQRAKLAFARARAALVGGDPDARRKALAVALAPSLHPELLRPRSRLRATGWSIAPAAAAARLRRVDQEAWEGPGGVVLARPRVLRLAFYCDSPVIGGAERSLGMLLERLDERFETTVVGTRPDVLAWLGDRRPGASAVLLPHVERKRDLRAIAAHVRALRRLHPDVLHFNLSGPWESHWALLAALATPRTRTVVVVHSPQAARRRRQRIVHRVTALRATAYVSVGERSSRELERVTGLPPGSVRTIRNGVADVPLEPLPRPRAGPIVGSLGRLEPEKGFDVLLRALPAVPEATLVLVGEGSTRGPLEALGEELGIAERVVFAGWSDDARRHLTTFDVFALPSRFEAFPLSVLEAMLASLPVVASDVGSVGEAVEDGRTGVLVPPEDPEALGHALRDLLEDPERARALGRHGREQALERFSVDAMVQAYERLYEEVAR